MQQSGLDPIDLNTNTTVCVFSDPCDCDWQTLAMRGRLWNLTPRLCSGYASESTPRQCFFCPICVQGLPPRCLWGVSNFRVEAKGSSKMAAGATNQSCSFNCKWQPPYWGRHFRGRNTSFRVRRRIKFICATSNRYPERSPAGVSFDCYLILWTPFCVKTMLVLV